MSVIVLKTVTILKFTLTRNTLNCDLYVLIAPIFISLFHHIVVVATTAVTKPS